MKLPLVTLESSQPAKPTEPASADPSPTTEPGTVFAVNGRNRLETCLMVGRVFSEAEAQEVLAELPSCAYGLSASGFENGDRHVGICNAPQAAADLVAQPIFNIRAKTHRQVLTNVLWNCACAQIRQENSTFFHNPFNPHEHGESANQRSARADFAGALLVHNGKQLKNFNAVWEATKDRKNAGLFRPEAELLAMVQRTAADQLMVGGKVEFTDPDLCADVRKSPDFLLDPELSKGGKVVVVAVNDPDQPGYQITSSLAGWLKGQQGRKAVENPYQLPSEAPVEQDQTATL